MKKYYIMILISGLLTLVGLFYIQKCNLSGSLMSICLFENTRGLPLPFYHLGEISLFLLLIDFLFWLLVSFIIYFSIFYIIKLLKFLIKK